MQKLRKSLVAAVSDPFLVSAMLGLTLMLCNFQAIALPLVQVNLPLPKLRLTQSSSLAKQKSAELDRRWLECSSLGATNFSQFKELRPWIALSQSECSRKIKPSNGQQLQAALNSLATLGEQKNKGPWSKDLAAIYLNQLWALAMHQAQQKTGVTPQVLGELFERESQLEQKPRGQIYVWAAIQAQNTGNLKAALQLIEQSLAVVETTEARGFRTGIRLALNLPAEKPLANELPGIAWSEAEGQFEQRLEQAAKANDAVLLLDDCLAYLRKFPLGRKAEWAESKVIEIYNQFFDLSQKPENQEQMVSVIFRSIELMKKADAGRLLAWSRVLHKRGDFRGAQGLAEVALKTRVGTADAAVLYFILGRSSQFLGDYSTAKNAFQNYLADYSGGEDVIEVLMRLGLVYLRMGEPASAVAVFEKLLNQKNIDRYELSARYWLVRSLQSMGNSRAEAEIEFILEKNIFSYYGLRLLSERQNGRLSWPTAIEQNPKFKGSLWLTASQKKSLERAQTLIANNWVNEAQKEIADLPLPETVGIKVLWAGELAKTQAFPRVIKLLTEVGDGDKNFKSLDLVSLGFPTLFENLIEEYSKRQNLNSNLVKSLIRQESAFSMIAKSKSNALGLMQLIPPTAAEVASDLGLKEISIPDDVYSPRINIQMGTHYIRKMLDTFSGNVPMALAAYNAGPTRLGYFVRARQDLSQLQSQHSSEPKNEMWFDELPWFETSFYVKAILRNALIYKMIERAKPDSKPETRQFDLPPVLWSDLVLVP